jgi:hypothetical protein
MSVLYGIVSYGLGLAEILSWARKQQPFGANLS